MVLALHTLTEPTFQTSEADTDSTCHCIGVVMVSGNLVIVPNRCPDPPCPFDRNVRIDDH
jgi:hypothetical protein